MSPGQDGCVHGAALVAFGGQPRDPALGRLHLQPEPKEKFRNRETRPEPPVRARTRGLQRASSTGCGAAVLISRRSGAHPGAPQGGAAARRPAGDRECACSGQPPCGAFCLLAVRFKDEWACKTLSSRGNFSSFPSVASVVLGPHACAGCAPRAKALLSRYSVCACSTKRAGYLLCAGNFVPVFSVLRLHARLILRLNPREKGHRAVNLTGV